MYLYKYYTRPQAFIVVVVFVFVFIFVVIFVVFVVIVLVVFIVLVVVLVVVVILLLLLFGGSLAAVGGGCGVAQSATLLAHMHNSVIVQLRVSRKAFSITSCDTPIFSAPHPHTRDTQPLVLEAFKTGQDHVLTANLLPESRAVPGLAPQVPPAEAADLRVQGRELARVHGQQARAEKEFAIVDRGAELEGG